MKSHLRIPGLKRSTGQIHGLLFEVCTGTLDAFEFGSVIIHDFAIKSPFFMLLGACRLKKRILALVVGLWASLSFLSCGGSAKTGPPSGLTERVLASQGITATLTVWRSFTSSTARTTLFRGFAPITGVSNPGTDGCFSDPKLRRGLRRRL